MVRKKLDYMKNLQFTGPFVELNDSLQKSMKALEKAKLALRRSERRMALGVFQKDKESEIVKNRRYIINLLDTQHTWLRFTIEHLEKSLDVLNKQGLLYSSSGVESLKELRHTMLNDMRVLERKENKERD